MVSRHYLRVYAAGDVDEEDLCVEVRGAVVGGEASGSLTASGVRGRFRLYGFVCIVYETYFVCSYVQYLNFLKKHLTQWGLQSILYIHLGG